MSAVAFPVQILGTEMHPAADRKCVFGLDPVSAFQTNNTHRSQLGLQCLAQKALGCDLLQGRWV